MQNRKMKVKAVWLYVITALMLGTIAAVIYWSDPFSTFSARERDFAVDDIEEVDKVELTSNNNSLSLKKKGEMWRVNGAFEVRSRAMLVLLDALAHLQAGAPVSKKQLPRIQEHLLEEGIRVQVYYGRRELKRFIVSRKDFAEKTYMLMEGAALPYQVHIPAFSGQVATLFQIDQNYWRSPMIFDIKPQEIEQVSVQYPEKTSSGFELNVTANGYYSLQTVSGNEVKSINDERIARYLAFFQAVKYEKILADDKHKLRDSLMTATPWVQIHVKSHGGDVSTLEVFRKPASGKKDAFGQTSEFDLDRAYALLNGSEEIIQIQYFVFDPIFKEIDYFRMP
jgi:hypothetical protein